MNFDLRRVWAVATGVALVVGVAAVVNLPAAHAAQSSTGGPVDKLPSAVPSTITPAVNDGKVYATAQVGNTVVIGGSFTSVGGQSHSHLAIFNATSGTLSALAPSANNDVNAVLPGPTSTTVYIGGSFTQVNGTNAQFVALLDFTTGNLVSSFNPPAFDYGYVNDMVARGGRLYLGGTFAHAGGKLHQGLVALNGTTGALDPFMNVQLTGHHNDSGSGAQGWVGPWSMDATRDGKTMVVIGNFKQATVNVSGAPVVTRDQVIMIDLSGSSAQISDWNTNRYSPYCFNWAFDAYVRGVNFSPDGSYFVVNATGGGVTGTLCDATSRFENDPTNGDAQPTWVDETGGDTVWAVTVTNTAVFIGGHNRWNNNPQGVDHALPGAVPRPGLAALDPISGRPFTWNPGRNPLGTAVYSLLSTDDGLWVGSNTDWIGNYKYLRPKLAYFPYAGGYTPAATTTASLPGTVFLGGSQGTGQSNVLYRIDAGGPAIQSLDNGPDWAADNSDPSAYRNNGSNPASWSPGAAINPSVPATTPSAIFNSERWSPSDNPAMKWAFPVASGTHLQVRLYFANRCTCTSGVGQRIFNVDLDGTRVLSNYDIVADVGDQTGTMKSFNITSDGTVNIDFSHVTENPLINGIEIINTDLPTPPPGSTDSLSTVAYDGTTATGASASNQGIDFGNWRGAFLVGNKVFYGYTDSYLYYRTFDGTTFGAAVKVDPYHDPVWDGVDTHDGTTFDGAFPTLYGQIPNLTGMVYSKGRVYYTLFGDSNLYSRWFSPDSGIVDETTVTATSSVSFSDADGMFISGGNLYYVSRGNGNLNRVAFDNGTVSGPSTVVSGPGADGVSWKNRALFLAAAAPVNQKPTARFSSDCSALSCSFDGSASSDADGTIAGYDWTFGDGTTGSGATPPVHTYTSGNTYSVTLKVTDNQGATDTVTHTVTVAPATSGVQFVGSANAGGGNVRFKELTVPNSASAGDTALLFLARATTATWTGPTGVTGWTQVDSYANGPLTTTLFRKVLTAGDVGTTVRMDNPTYGHASMDLVVYSGVDASTPIAALAQSGDSGVTAHTTPQATAGADDYALSYWAGRSNATRVWTAPNGASVRDASTDSGTPTTQALITDSNGPIPAGSYGGLTATTDAAADRVVMWTIVLNPSSGAPVNAPPTAAFTSNCVNLTCTFNGSGSGDTDGSISTYAWTFGDGSTGSGVTPPAHTYPSDGTYSVTLTVTDNAGATDSVSHDVAVTTTGSGVQFVAATNAGGGNTKFRQLTVPETAAAGQTALLFIANASTATWSGPSGVTGWVQAGTFASGSLSTTMWTKVLSAADIGAAVRFDNTTYGHASVNLAVYSGIDAANPISAIAQAGDSATASHTTPSATAGAGDWVVSYWADRSTATRTWTAPSSVTVRDTSTDTANPTMQAMIADSNGAVAVGSYGGLTATTDANTDRAAMWTIVLNAA